MGPDAATRHALHLVAMHVVARARVEATGRFSLRVTPGGFGTPELAPHGRRVRVSGATLIVESDAPGEASARALPIRGTTLNELATFAGVDLNQPLDVGHDTMPVGDPDQPLALDGGDAAIVNDWFHLSAAVLDAILARLPSTVPTTLPRLWPEHFDLAIEAQATPTQRVNLGGSPGDGFCNEPYLYVGPWTSARPGPSGFWNAPFGAYRTRAELTAGGAALHEAGVAFLLAGVERVVGAERLG